MRSTQAHGKNRIHDPATRGYHVVYREQEKNYCPGCGRTHWWLGRMSAECFYCGVALPLMDAQMSGGGLHVRCGTSTEAWHFE